MLIVIGRLTFYLQIKRLTGLIVAAEIFKNCMWKTNQIYFVGPGRQTKILIGFIFVSILN